MASCSLQRSFSSFSINLMPIPRLTTLSSDIFMFDHTTSAFRPNGPWSGMDMLIINLSFKARGFRQTTKAPPRLMSLNWTSSLRPDFSMTACQEIVIRGCWRFCSHENFFLIENRLYLMALKSTVFSNICRRTKIKSIRRIWLRQCRCCSQPDCYP